MHVYRLLLLVIGIVFTCALKAQPKAKPVAAPPSAPPPSSETKKDTTDPYYIDFTGVEWLKGDSEKKEEPKTETKKDTSNPFLLDFSDFDWDNYIATKKDTPLKETKTEAKKDTTNPFLLDFSNYDWNAETKKDVPQAKMHGTVIGTQTWAFANYNAATFKNGDAIPEAKNSSDWEVAYYNKKPMWCYYNFDAANGAKYGKLYNVYAVTDARGLAPAGWHIPTKAEWDKMKAIITADAAKMRSITEGGYGFVQGGYLGHNDFVATGKAGCWWSSTPKTVYGAYGASINQGGVGFVFNNDYPTFYEGDYTTQGLSVRLVKD